MGRTIIPGMRNRGLLRPEETCQEWRAIRDEARSLAPERLPSGGALTTLWTELKTESARQDTSIFETSLSLQDARLNTVMKKLTAWAAIIAVPTAVTGWFGQNIPYPGFGHISGVIGSTAIIVGIAIGLYITFKRKDWI